MKPGTLQLSPLRDFPAVLPGDSLGQLVVSGTRAQDITPDASSVLIVAQKVVSKVEGRARRLADVAPGAEALEAATRAGKDPAVVELIARESQELMRVAPGVIIARHRTGHVLANAGIDASNVGDGEDPSVLLWPQDPDASARNLRDALTAATGVRLAVIISDSLGRAWRVGTMGSAGLKPLRDRRGEPDLFGRELQATVIGVADEIAAAASLVMGEAAEGTPVAIVRGAAYDLDEDAGIGELLRPLQMDLFR